MMREIFVVVVFVLIMDRFISEKYSGIYELITLLEIIKNKNKSSNIRLLFWIFLKKKNINNYNKNK